LNSFRAAKSLLGSDHRVETPVFPGILGFSRLQLLGTAIAFTLPVSLNRTAVARCGLGPDGVLDIDETTLAWVADDVPLGLVTLCRLQRDQAGTSSFFCSGAALNSELLSPIWDFGLQHADLR
jgi:hypothetical protein